MDLNSPGYVTSSDEYSNDEDDLMDGATSLQNTSNSEAHTESINNKKKCHAKKMDDARKCFESQKKGSFCLVIKPLQSPEIKSSSLSLFPNEVNDPKNKIRFNDKEAKLQHFVEEVLNGNDSDNMKTLQSPEIKSSSLSLFPNEVNDPKNKIRFNDKEAKLQHFVEEVLNGNDSSEKNTIRLNDKEAVVDLSEDSENMKHSDIVISSVISLENGNASIIKTSKIKEKVEDITNHEVMQPAQSNDIKLDDIKSKSGDIKMNNIESKISHNHSVSNDNVQGSKKRLRSISPPSNGHSNEDKNINSQDKFYSEIDEMFAKNDQTLKTYINYIYSNGENVDGHIRRLATEIDTVNELIETRKNEIERLFYFKQLKEGYMYLYEREKQKNLMQEKSQNTKSGASNTSSAEEAKSTSTKDSVECVANMGTVELEKERPNTSGLYSKLQSENILDRAQNANYSNASAKVKNIPNLLRIPKYFENQQYLELRPKPNVGRQGPFRLIDNYRNQNLNKPQPEKKFKYHDFPDSMPTHNKSYNEDYLANFSYNLNRNLGICKSQSGINQDYQNNYRMQISHYESENVSMSNNIPYFPRRYNNIRSHTNTAPRLSGNEMNNDNDVCHECKSTIFVGDGCRKQVYCSRECRLKAWDRYF
ncbi:uncharacterized protein LOC119662222 [Teleopsis dalmanni]|uniref:uncharacterized protein LOC119662222 n=1 Tax=Teleopsis dalmanni TaxID=139649 RepID=UPI0018CE1D95|nr:uncharacterized protein LOC119662222 [Teleopsis dalmanni]